MNLTKEINKLWVSMQCLLIIFLDEKLLIRGMHTNALHLKVSILETNIIRVLIDGGDLVNNYLLQTIQLLEVM